MQASLRFSFSGWPAAAAVITAAVVLLVATSSAALQVPAPLRELPDEDTEALEWLATRAAEPREAALRASQHVGVLVAAQRIQENSSTAFRDRIEKLPRPVQEQMWEIVREPGLIDELAALGPKDTRQLDTIAKRYAATPTLHKAIRELGRKQAAVLDDVVAIDRDASERFEALLAKEVPSAETREAFRVLLSEPELFSMLAARVDLAVHLGDAYRSERAALNTYLDRVGADVNARNAAAAEEWKTEIQSDPVAEAEFQQATQAYAREYGYAYDSLTGPRARTDVHVVIHPYPYWFGFPLWHTDLAFEPYWPYGYGYYGYWYPVRPHFGFRYSAGHRVYFGLPSRHFVHWFYGRDHHGHYRQLGNRFSHHYQRHQHARDPFHRSLSYWSEPRRHDRSDGAIRVRRTSTNDRVRVRDGWRERERAPMIFREGAPRHRDAHPGTRGDAQRERRVERRGQRGGDAPNAATPQVITEPRRERRIERREQRGGDTPRDGRPQAGSDAQRERRVERRTRGGDNTPRVEGRQQPRPGREVPVRRTPPQAPSQPRALPQPSPGREVPVRRTPPQAPSQPRALPQPSPGREAPVRRTPPQAPSQPRALPQPQAPPQVQPQAQPERRPKAMGQDARQRQERKMRDVLPSHPRLQKSRDDGGGPANVGRQLRGNVGPRGQGRARGEGGGGGRGHGGGGGQGRNR